MKLSSTGAPLSCEQLLARNPLITSYPERQFDEPAVAFDVSLFLFFSAHCWECHLVVFGDGVWVDGVKTEVLVKKCYRVWVSGLSPGSPDPGRKIEARVGGNAGSP